MRQRDIEEIFDSLEVQYYGDFLDWLEVIIDNLEYFPDDVIADDDSVKFEYSNRKGDSMQFTLYEERDIPTECCFISRYDDTAGKYEYDEYRSISFINDKVKELYSKK